MAFTIAKLVVLPKQRYEKISEKRKRMSMKDVPFFVYVWRSNKRQSYKRRMVELYGENKMPRQV